ncbi:hypothetical protein [Sphaerisporangium corydalis]|uniref:Crocagin biosynthetic protein CgnE/B domain-containing protein n=1 Tax=Sphaerisporangium corydalis TaxID=1441875 RepID=A0ABV9ETQ3_9ACTN|nr:hypothetical protein [Sphaerisporangium corydalis]
MKRQIMVKPAAFRQFGAPADTFCLVTDADLADDFLLDESGGSHGTYGARSYRDSRIVPVEAGRPLDSVLTDDIPASADVVVIRRRAFLSSPEAELIGAGRRIVVMPCASTPVTVENIRYFLGVVERTDPSAQAKRADQFFEAVEESGGLRFADDARSTACQFDPTGGDYVWNQQAGYLGPGEQQIAPAGELSVLPIEITDFDPDRGLALDGTLTLRGPAIVHAGYDEALVEPQARLYERLAPLERHPVLLDVRDGVITGVRGADTAAPTAGLVAAFEELLTEDPRYRTIWELGFGINTDMRTVPGNCGLNEPFGATGGAVHIGVGLTPFTRFALTFLCPDTVVTDSSDTIVLGSGPLLGHGARKIKRTYAGSCGCH